MKIKLNGKRVNGGFWTIVWPLVVLGVIPSAIVAQEIAGLAIAGAIPDLSQWFL